MMRHKILIVEDEPEIANLIRNRLDKSLYLVSVVHSAEDALEYLKREHFDLLTLDVMLPGIDGITLCSQLRESDKETLILIVTALATEEDIETGYMYGADDYICKPFSPRTLAVKIQALLTRRTQLQQTPLRRYGILEYDADNKTVSISSQNLRLTPSEYIILSTMLDAPKKVFSRNDLAQIIYDNDLGNTDHHGLNTHVYTLRKKISALTDVDVIKTVRQFGYRLYEH